MIEVELKSPFLNWQGTVKNKRRFWIIMALWMTFWLTVSVALGYVYAFLLPGWVGFETAVLVGIAILIFFSSGD